MTFTFNPSISTSENDEFQKDFRFFVDQIPYARNVRHGIDLGMRPNNASYALVAHFQDEADFQQYLDHPLHKGLIQSTIVSKCESWLGTQFLTAE
ncbi:Dabb family protein [Rhodococcus sp. IEGM 248]|nr:Dabb family protein [Rhodococcus sp. IEGM 248]